MMGILLDFRVAVRTAPMFLVTAALLLVSNVFMTFAWDGHLKYKA